MPFDKGSNMNASKPIRSCDDVRLDLLLFGEEDSNEFRVISEHVESCSRCQERLNQTADRDGECTEIVAALRECQDESGDLSLASESNSNCSSRRSIKLDFLAPPSHPE